MVSKYGKVVGPTLVLIGVVGLLLGQKSLFGALNIDIAEDAIHLLTGGLLVYVGFAGANSSGWARTVVGGIGVVYLLVGLVSFAEPNPLGLFPSEYSVLDNVIHITLGILAIGVAWLLPKPAASDRTRSGGVPRRPSM